MIKLNKGERILLIDILRVLARHTDEENPIKQKEIIEKLTEDFKYDYEDLYSKRKTVKNNIDKLLEYSKCSDMNEIMYEESSRQVKGKVYKEFSNFNYVHDFTHGELRLIIDSILFSKQIPSSQREELIEKLTENLASKHFKSGINHVRAMSDNELTNKELFYNIEILDEAIRNRKQVSFMYNQYDVDEKSNLVLTPRLSRDGSPREYLINPYQMVATNGRYYLICNYDYFDTLSHYRLDRITNIKLVDQERKPIKEIKGQKRKLDLQTYMKEHIYMFAGESVTASLRFKKHVLSEFIDWFGTEDISFSNQTEDEITARVKVNKEAMRKWALQYAIHVTVLSPDDLVENIKADLRQALEKYE